MNYDISMYEFRDLDLEQAAGEMEEHDRIVLVLFLMGHTQRDIAQAVNLTHGTISKQLAAITKQLRRRLCGFREV